MVSPVDFILEAVGVQEEKINDKERSINSLS
jgi:hypothetical protein